MKTELGKIKKVKFGFGGYQDAMIGLSVEFSFKSSGCHDFKDGGWTFPPSENAQWTVDDQTRLHGEMVRTVVGLMNQAKVDDVMKLEGVPIEATFDGMSLKSWRILEEVL